MIELCVEWWMISPAETPSLKIEAWSLKNHTEDENGDRVSSASSQTILKVSIGNYENEHANSKSPAPLSHSPKISLSHFTNCLGNTNIQQFRFHTNADCRFCSLHSSMIFISALLHRECFSFSLFLRNWTIYCISCNFMRFLLLGNFSMSHLFVKVYARVFVCSFFI